VNNHAHVLKPCDENLRFWADRIEAVNLTTSITGSTQPKLTIEALMNIRIAVPASRDERKAIEVHIRTATSPIDTLVVKTERSIQLLREHRTALITAAVTGKLDLCVAVQRTA
jgi:hypothetical protein